MATVSIPAAADKKLARQMWVVVVLLGISIFINYLDRGSLSVAASMLKDELGISAAQLGFLLSSFFWTYSFCQLFSGWLVDRYDVSWVLAGGFLLWSIAMGVTGALHAFTWLLLARLFLGVGESVCFPSYSKILARHFPEEQRGFANSVIIFGVAIGPAFSMFVGGMAMQRFGWRPFFLAAGVLSLLWLVPWMVWRPRQNVTRANTPAEHSPGALEIFRFRSAWGTISALFFTNYLSYFLLTWMPFYLQREQHYSLQQTAKIAGICYLAAACAAPICGRISDRLIARGVSRTLVRKGFAGGGTAFAAVALVMCLAGNPRLTVVMLVFATTGYGICCSNMWAITQTLAGPVAAGRWTGVQNAIGNLAGTLAPTVTGFVVEFTGRFYLAFAITAVVAVLATVSWFFIIGPIEPVTWRSRASA